MDMRSQAWLRFVAVESAKLCRLASDRAKRHGSALALALDLDLLPFKLDCLPCLPVGPIFPDLTCIPLAGLDRQACDALRLCRIRYLHKHYFRTDLVGDFEKTGVEFVAYTLIPRLLLVA